MLKPTYQAIIKHAPKKPIIVFVPSRKQSKLTALDLVAYSGAENQAQRLITVLIILGGGLSLNS